MQDDTDTAPEWTHDKRGSRGVYVQSFSIWFYNTNEGFKSSFQCAAADAACSM